MVGGSGNTTVVGGGGNSIIYGVDDGDSSLVGGSGNATDRRWRRQQHHLRRDGQRLAGRRVGSVHAERRRGHRHPPGQREERAARASPLKRRCPGDRHPDRIPHSSSRDSRRRQSRGFGQVAVALGSGQFILDASHTSAPVELFGGTGNSTILAGSGNDSLFAGSGTDSLVGGPGHDTYFFGQNVQGSVTINNATDSSDTLDFSQFAAGINLDLDNTGPQAVEPRAA